MKKNVPVAEPEVLVDEPAETPLFTTGTWNGLSRWACTQCPWDTLDGEDAMLEHVAEAHTPAPAPVSRIIPVYDRYGNLVNPEAVGG